jgi:hypothetical protein
MFGEAISRPDRPFARGAESITGPEFGVCAAVDVHYPGTAGARAALVLAAEAVFVHVLAERTAALPRVPPC